MGHRPRGCGTLARLSTYRPFLMSEGLGLPTDLKSIGIGPEDFPAIAEHTMHDAGVRTGARPIHGPEDIVEILELARG